MLLFDCTPSWRSVLLTVCCAAVIGFGGAANAADPSADPASSESAAADANAVQPGSLMATALAHKGEHKGEHPEASTGLVRDVREVTHNFHDVAAAMAVGYVSAGSCESGPNEGAMGVHYVNDAFVDDGVLDVQRPEVLVYEPRDGQLRLVAVEFFVIAEQWDATNAGSPVLGGQLFNYVGAPNRLRLPPHYELHVWAWKRNPNGTFSDWNPQVSCVEYTGEAEGRGSGH